MSEKISKHQLALAIAKGRREEIKHLQEILKDNPKITFDTFKFRIEGRRRDLNDLVQSIENPIILKEQK